MRTLRSSFYKLASVVGGSPGEWIYTRLNGFGTAIIELEFRTSDCRHLIESAATGAGWIVEDDTRWEQGHRLTLIRTGRGVVGPSTREGWVRELQKLLSSIPDKVVLLQPRFVRPDYNQVPQWGIDLDGTTTDPPVLDHHPLGLYGDYAAAARQIAESFPGGRPIPRNAASRLERPTMATMGWNWHAAIVLAACVGGTYGEGITANLSQLLSDDGLSSAFSNNLWINSGFGLYGLMALWLTLCLALHVLSVLGAALLGFFKQSEFEVHLMFRRKTKLPVRIRRILTNRAWPSKELVADRGSRTYLRIRWLYVLLARMGAGCFAGAVIRNGLATAEKLPGGIAAVVGGAAVLGLIWVVGRLIAAHLLLRSGRLPRLAFSVGSLAISLTVFVRFPAWAYVEGIGVGNLVGTIELPQLIFFGSALIVMAAVLTSGWLLFWLAKRLDGVARFIMKAMAIVSVTLCFLTIAQTEMNAGTNLRVRGTSEFAKTSYPIAACLQQIPVSGPPTAVWLLGNRDNQTVVSTRSPNGLALSSPGQVSILPTDSITLTLVPAEKREETEGVAELGVRPCSFAESQLDDEVPSHEAEVPSHEAGSLASLRFGLEF